MAEILADSKKMNDAVRAVAESLIRKISRPHAAAFIGIHTHGVPLARRLQAIFDDSAGCETVFGTLDITLYRDDYDLRGLKPRIQSSEVRFAVDERELVLVDDVLFTGRTVRAAIEALGDYGRPRAIRLAALVDRGRRELPIQPDAVGFSIDAEPEDRIRVRMTEIDGKDEVLLIPGGLKPPAQ